MRGKRSRVLCCRGAHAEHGVACGRLNNGPPVGVPEELLLGHVASVWRAHVASSPPRDHLVKAEAQRLEPFMQATESVYQDLGYSELRQRVRTLLDEGNGQ